MARKQAADAPEKKPNWFKQIWSAYKITRQTDPQVTLYVLGSIAAVLLVAAIIGVFTGAWFFIWTMAIPLALVAGMLMLVRRAEAAAYKRIEGKPGAALSAVGTVRTGQWTWEDEPAAFNAKTGEMVYRGVGRGGVVLVTEGGADFRATKLAEQETKRIKRVIPEAPVTVIRIGDEEGKVKLTKLSRHVTKMKPVLSKTEVAEVTKRLKTLSSKRTLPIPKGVDPFNTRPDRKGLKGK
ncbi:MAG: DUF4191 domain-containing protein [Promicromonosporaceae bacterium]|nr:DUF4191 domain-containing protein [Promicromonosporaceae bacterium]